MKLIHFVKSRTILAALSLPIFSWIIQYINGGFLPEVVQTWGPLSVAIVMICLRLCTTKALLGLPW